MSARTMLDLTLISAKDLKDVNLLSTMKVYVVASIDGDPRTQQRTSADRDGGRSPSWNYTLRLPIPSGDPSRHALHLLLRTERLLGDRDVGEVHIPLREILDSASSGSSRVPSYKVRKPSSRKAKGTLDLSYKITDAIAVADASIPTAACPSYTVYPPHVKAFKADEHVAAYPSAAYPPPAKADEPVTAYPAAYAHPTGYPAYPPPQYGYTPAQPQARYGYPPPAGYGYAAAPPKKGKNSFGMGLGAGLLGGALGGLLIGDMVSDVADYDAGYEAGFDDAGGF